MNDKFIDEYEDYNNQGEERDELSPRQHNVIYYSPMLAEYENGTLGYEQVLELFTGLIETGLINQLQGSYQRRAAQLINTGQIPWDK